MANNLVEYLAQLKSSSPKRANWFQDLSNVGTNDWGFGKVKFCKEVIAGSKVRYDFKSAYSTNPTISPVLSRAKVNVTAWWIPIRLYVPALRDGVEVKSGKTDYSFPIINFDYGGIRVDYDNLDNPLKPFGVGSPYIPANSIYSELGMWSPYYQPLTFAAIGNVPTPGGRNAIPLLGYYDIFRNYIMNTQDNRFPIRTRGFSRILVFNDGDNLSGDPYRVYTRDPEDTYYDREDLDQLFGRVRAFMGDYPMDSGYDIYPQIRSFLPFPTKYGTQLLGPDGVTPIPDKAVCFNDNHYGEWRATYHGDFFTSYLSNENVEYERSTARVQADDEGVITMEQIYSMQKVQSYVRRTVFKNSDYSEFVDAHYGVTPSTTMTKPMFMGSVSTWLSFNDVIAQAQTSNSDGNLESNTDLGSRASIGFGRMVTGSLRPKKDRPFVEFTALEPGYFMVIETIVPEVHYWQGYDPMYDKHTLESLYYPSFDRDGYQDKQISHLVESGQGFNDKIHGLTIDTYNFAYAQEPAWWEYMVGYNRMTGQMVEDGVYRHWVFHRDILPQFSLYSGGVSPTGPVNPSRVNIPLLEREATNTYVEPEQFNSIFANINGLDNIQTYYRHEFKAYQPLSHRFLSF